MPAPGGYAGGRRASRHDDAGHERARHAPGHGDRPKPARYPGDRGEFPSRGDGPAPGQSRLHDPAEALYGGTSAAGHRAGAASSRATRALIWTERVTPNYDVAGKSWAIAARCSP